MRTAILIAALILGCSSGSERREAEEPEAPSEAESDGFSREQQEALSELLGEDVTSRPENGEEPAPASPAASSSARPPP